MSFKLSHYIYGLIVLSLLIIVSSCSEQYSHTLKLQSVLTDGSKLKTDLIVTMNNQEDLDILIEKEKKIQQAFFIIFRDYKPEHINKSGSATAKKVVQRIIDSKLNVPVKTFSLENYTLTER